MELSITRIGLLMKKQLIENKKLYLLGLLGIIGVMSLVFFATISNINGFDIRTQGIFMGVGMISFGCLFTLRLFSNLNTAAGRTQAFLLPVSAIEKLISTLIFALVVFPIVYILSVYPMLVIAHYTETNYFGGVNELYVFNLRDIQIIILTIFFIAVSAVLLISVLMKRVKAFIFAGIFAFGFFGFNYLYPVIIDNFLPQSFTKKITVSQRFFGLEGEISQTKSLTLDQTYVKQNRNTPFFAIGYYSSETYFQLELTTTQKKAFYFFLLLSIPFMWLIAWFRLRESELSES